MPLARPRSPFVSRGHDADERIVDVLLQPLRRHERPRTRGTRCLSRDECRPREYECRERPENEQTDHDRALRNLHNYFLDAAFHTAFTKKRPGIHVGLDGGGPRAGARQLRRRERPPRQGQPRL